MLKKIRRVLLGAVLAFALISLPIFQQIGYSDSLIQAAEKPTGEKIVDAIIGAVGSVCPGGNDMCATVTITVGGVVTGSVTFYLGRQK